MSAPELIRGIVYAVLLIWLLFQLAHRPHNIPLRALTGLIICWVVAYPFGVAAYAGGTLLLGDKLTEEFIGNALDMGAGFCLILFFLFTLYESPGARRRAWRQAVPLAVGILGLAVLTVMIPADQRDAVAQMVAQTVNGKPHVSPPIGGWYNLIPNAYQLWTFIYAFVVTCRYIRGGTDRLLRHGMVLTAIGTGLIVFALCTFIIANLSASTHAVSIPGPLLSIGIGAAFAGIPIFLIGIGYRSGRMRVASTRVWLHHRQAYRQLHTLWVLLHKHFPEDELTRAPASGWRYALNPGGTHRRYYRRVIECRDGLVRISPYIAKVRQDNNGHAASLSLAQQLGAAFELHDRGVEVPPAAIPIAPPAGRGLDSDTRELLALSRALRKNGIS